MRLQSLDLNVVFFTQKPLITLQIAAPHGMTVSSNVATVWIRMPDCVRAIGQDMCQRFSPSGINPIVSGRGTVHGIGYISKVFRK